MLIRESGRRGRRLGVAGVTADSGSWGGSIVVGIGTAA